MATEPTTGNDYLNKEVIQWGCNYLSSHGYTLKNNLPENVQDTPWSYIAIFTFFKTLAVTLLCASKVDFRFSTYELFSSGLDKCYLIIN